jgi:hypothetical protein
MGARIKSWAVAVACIVIGLGVARASLARAGAGAPAPAPASSASGGPGYDVLALVVVALVAVLAIGLYWRHQRLKLAALEANTDGFVRRKQWQLRDLWECPVCGLLMRLECVDIHRNTDYSLCAFFSAWLDEHEGTSIREFVRAFSPNWPGASNDSMSGGDGNGGVSVSATMAPDHSVTTGGYDTLNPGMRAGIED